MSVDIEIKPFDELTRRQLYELMVLRNRVFVVEQEITAEPEIDGRDTDADHALMRLDGELIGTVRILRENTPLKVGRVAVARSERGRGLGSEMMRAVGEYLGDRPAKLHAQSHLEQWYRRLGWRREGPEFQEAGIPHVAMVWPPRRG